MAYTSLSKHSVFEILLVAFCSTAIMWHIWPALTPGLLAGWDLVPHYYLVQKAAENLAHGKIFAYDSQWLGGYPMFTLYPPLPIVSIAAVDLIFGSSLDAVGALNFTISLIPFVLLIALCFCCRAVYGKDSAWAGLVVGMFFLLSPKGLTHANIGLSGLYELGAISNYFALPLFIFLIAIQERFQGTREKRDLIILSLLISALILSHLLTAIAALSFYCLGLLLAPSWSHRKLLCIPLVVACIVTSFWWIPFLESLWLSSGAEVGLSLAALDLLVGLFPGIDSLRNFYWLSFQDQIRELPVIGVSCLVLGLYGIILSVREKNYRLLIAFVVLALILPRTYLKDQIDLSIHYYRFVQPLVLVFLLFVAKGLAEFSSLVSRTSAPLRHLCLVIGIALGSFVCFFQYELSGDEAHEFQFQFNEYRFTPRVMELVRYLQQNPGEGRIATEVLNGDMRRLGSPHVLSSLISLSSENKILPGLLIESSLVAPLYNPLIGTLADPRSSVQMLWGRKSFFTTDLINRSPLELLNKLRYLGIERIVATSKQLRTRLYSLAGAELIHEKRISPFEIFRFRNPRPLLEKIDKPIAYLDLGGIPFRVFSEEWFKHSIGTSESLVLFEQNHRELLQRHAVDLKLVLVSTNNLSGTDAREELLSELPPIPVTFIHRNELEYVSADRTSRQKIEYDSPYPYELIDLILDKLPARSADPSEVDPISVSDEFIQFNVRGPVLINNGYHPRWRSSNTQVFFAGPHQMLVFAEGETTLRYE